LPKERAVAKGNGGCWWQRRPAHIRSPLTNGLSDLALRMRIL
jgi:hypothetical protein